MAKITGVMTGWKGKIGNMVFSMWKGIQVAKTRAIPHNPRSTAQTIQRTKFSVLIAIMKAINVAIIQTFWEPFVGSYITGWAQFSKKNLLAQVGDTFNYALMILSLGSLYRTLITTSTYDTASGDCVISWADSDENNQEQTDRSYMFWIDETTGQFWYDVLSVVARSVGTATVTGVTGLTPAEIHSYLWFDNILTDEEYMVSDSQYLITESNGA